MCQGQTYGSRGSHQQPPVRQSCRAHCLASRPLCLKTRLRRSSDSSWFGLSSGRGRVLRAGSHPGSLILKLILDTQQPSCLSPGARASPEQLLNTYESIISCRDAPDGASADRKLKITRQRPTGGDEDLLRSSEGPQTPANMRTGLSSQEDRISTTHRCCTTDRL